MVKNKEATNMSKADNAKNQASAAKADESIASTPVVADASLPEFNKPAEAVDSANSVYVASSLQNGIVFRELTTIKGGVLRIPGLNERIRGAEGGLLADRGSSILVKMTQDQWEEIKAKYGTMPAFTHKPPFLREFKSKQDYNSDTAQSELKSMRTGAEPLTEDDLKNGKSSAYTAK